MITPNAKTNNDARRRQAIADWTSALCTQGSDEAQIRQVVADWMNALGAKELDQLMSRDVAEDAVLDAVPPFPAQGAARRRTSSQPAAFAKAEASVMA